MRLDRGVVLRVLGPVRIRAGDQWVTPGPAQLRLLIGVMAWRSGRVVPVEELIDTIWDRRPPRSARSSLQSLVTRLRHVLEPVPGIALARYGAGYRIELASDMTDLGKFRSLVRAARAEDGPAAIGLFDAALALWNGPALADVADTAAVSAIRQGLAEEFMSTVQDRLTCMVMRGLEREAASELPAAAARYPLNERIAGMLMVARYRSGQRADALRVFRLIRRKLVAELGVEPGPELQRLHQRILSGDEDLARPAMDLSWRTHRERDSPAGPVAIQRPPVVPRQLPPAPVQFVGRLPELRRLDESIQARRPNDAPVIWTITGSAGVGKTALAAYWAHRAAGHFADGQLYVDLKGFSPAARPVTPEQAIRGFLQALGIPSAELPEPLDAQAALYRSMLAGKRVLVMLDNALDTEQVRTLLPGGPGCAVVLTSRADLDGLVVSTGARVLSLGVLPQAESCELIARRLGAGRARAEPEAVADLARSCGGLPLGLAVVAARAAGRPGFPLSALLAEFSGQARLDALETADKTTSVREVLSWSYGLLSRPAARMFRLLGLHPGPDISVAAAASLVGGSDTGARRALSELTHAHMVTEHAPGRFTCHDLLHAYATEQAVVCEDAAEREAATLRVLDHYLYTAAAAARILYPSRDPIELDPVQPGTASERMPGRAAALGWFGAEHQVLLAIVEAAAAAGHDVHAWRLTAVMTDYLNREGHWHDLAALGRVALAAAKRAGDRRGEAHAHSALGTACLRFDWHEAARAHLKHSVALFRGSGATARQARCHVTIGQILAGQGQHRGARAEAERALTLYRQLGHRAGEANALGDLGWYLAMLGDCTAAVTCCGQALRLHRALGNPLGEAHAWDHLGFARHQLGDDDTAAACYRRALGLLRQVSDRPEQAAILTRLGDTYRSGGDREMALAAWRQALTILDELNDLSSADVRRRLDEQPREAAADRLNRTAG